MTIADTDVLIDFLRNRGEATTVTKLAKAGALKTTVISRFELMSGAKSPGQVSDLEALFAAIPALDLDETGADAASRIRQKLEQSGNAIGMADSLIAGIVISRGGRLLTRNRKHFERVPGLKLMSTGVN